MDSHERRQYLTTAAANREYRRVARAIAWLRTQAGALAGYRWGVERKATMLAWEAAQCMQPDLIAR